MQYKFSYCVEIREASQRHAGRVFIPYPILYMSKPFSSILTRSGCLTARPGDLGISDRAKSAQTASISAAQPHLPLNCLEWIGMIPAHPARTYAGY